MFLISEFFGISGLWVLCVLENLFFNGFCEKSWLYLFVVNFLDLALFWSCVIVIIGSIIEYVLGRICMLNNVDMMNGDVATLIATTDSVTSVVAAKEEVKQAVGDDLNSKSSIPCEWFVCDYDQTTTRFFVIHVGPGFNNYYIFAYFGL